MSHARQVALLSAPLLLVVACGEANYPDGLPELPPAEAEGNPLGCLPDLDGVIADDELPVMVGASVRYIVSTEPRAVELEGRLEEEVRTWDLSRLEADDRSLSVTTRSATQTWFADRLSAPADAYLVPLDAAGALVGVMERRPGSLLIHGTVSAEEAPADGQTLLLYDQPIDLFRLPLDLAADWSDEGEINDGRVNGLTIAARHTYHVRSLREGRLVLPDLTFDRVLQVATHIHQVTVVGDPQDWVQVSFLTECYGEVARVTSELGVSTADFTSAREVRRLGF